MFETEAFRTNVNKGNVNHKGIAGQKGNANPIANGRIELLAPAGNREALHAAVENGADAVYVGGKLFSARAQADNFDTDLLKEELQYAHARGVSIYLTMNTLVSDEEMEQALIFASDARLAGIDGIIVQDLGLAAALRRLFPDVPLHGSTQMTIYDGEGVRALEDMGFQRVVLARELTLDEAAEIARGTELEVEVFVHGALCICYSGQCLMSSMIGGRSGNRGKCAQPCRLPYRLTGSQPRYLLSPKDMWSLDNIVEIASSGITSLKIEGRMKSPEYVATVVRIYRKYLDLAIRQTERGDSSRLRIEETDRHDLLQIFNRGGFSQGYMKGKTGADMMSFEKPNNRGILLGKTDSSDSRTQSIRLKLEDRLNVGDGVEIWTGGSDSPGGTVSFIHKGRQQVKSANKGDVVEIGSFRGNIQVGKGIYKTTDIELNRKARESYTGKNTKRIPISGRAVLQGGKPLTLEVCDQDRRRAASEGTLLPEAAINRPLTEERLREQLLKTGSTPFDFTGLEISCEDGLTLPISEINEVRRLALEQLYQLRADRYAERLNIPGISEKIAEVLHGPERSPQPGQAQGQVLWMGGSRPRYLNDQEAKDIVGQEHQNGQMPRISLYFHKWDAGMDYTGLGADRVYLPFSAMHRNGFAQSVSALKSGGTEVFLWLPAVTRGNLDDLIDRFAESLKGGLAGSRNNEVVQEIDGVLAGNIGTVKRLMPLTGHSRGNAPFRLAGDISMNLFNSLAVSQAAALGLDSAAMSAELTLQQVLAIARENRSTTLEAAVYGRLPLMLSEYCPVGSTEGGMKTGTKCPGCCSKGHSYSLEDRMGMRFPVVCDPLDCRSVILNANVLFAPDVLNRLQRSGIGMFRLYFLEEGPERIRDLVKLYRASLTGVLPKENPFGELSERIKSEGHTKGHYFRGV